jgi:hypothetical protein
MRLPIVSSTTAVFALLGLTASLGAQVDSLRPAARSPQDLAGCYLLAVDGWWLPSGYVRDSVLPKLITLDTVLIDNGGWRLLPNILDSAGAISTTPARWRLRRDSVELSWPGGVRPTRVRLVSVGPGALSGYAIAERDTANHRRASANADARRVPCEGERPRRLATTDTARLVGDRLVVEPVGASFRMPHGWFGLSREASTACDDLPKGKLEERMRVDRRQLPLLTYVRGEWTEEFSNVADSVVPFDALVAQVSGSPWIPYQSCVSPVQIRIYVGDFSPEWVASRVATTGVRTAKRFFDPVRTVTDTAGWTGTRLTWRAFYYDYGGTASVEFLARRVRAHTVVLVFMYSGPVDRQPAERALVLESFSVQP